MSGVALRLDKDGLEGRLRVVWSREMVTGAYVAAWVSAQLAGGGQADCLLFAENPSHPLCEQDDRLDTVAPLVAQAAGGLGTNADDVLRLFRTLADLGLDDDAVSALAARLENAPR